MLVDIWGKEEKSEDESKVWSLRNWMHDVPVIDGGEKDVEIDSRELFLQFGYSPL